MTAFTIDAGPTGPVCVEVDGQDVTAKVAAAEVHVGVHQPTVVTLHEVAPGLISGDGIVRVASAATETIVEFLESIDPDQLEQDALAENTMDESLTATMLRELIRLAEGRR